MTEEECRVMKEELVRRLFGFEIPEGVSITIDSSGGLCFDFPHDCVGQEA